MSIEGLAEGIILQSMEDLWIKKYRKDCKDFFSGEGFYICADIAYIDLNDQVRLLNLVNEIILKEGRNYRVNGREFKNGVTS